MRTPDQVISPNFLNKPQTLQLTHSPKFYNRLVALGDGNVDHRRHFLYHDPFCLSACLATDAPCL